MIKVRGFETLIRTPASGGKRNFVAIKLIRLKSGQIRWSRGKRLV